MKALLKALIPRRYHEFLVRKYRGFYLKSYAQEGEDLVLNRFFEFKKNGFYIDIGAHHPKRFSNTYFFYKKGWRGINIDAMPGSMTLFNKIRPRDVNIETPVSQSGEILTYYAFDEPALNGFAHVNVNEMAGSKLLFTKQIKTERLETLLSHNVPANTKIDFMSIDVEGMDIEVLRSNNWLFFKPFIVLVETFGAGFEEVIESDVCVYMKSLGYLPIAKTKNTTFFKAVE